jgi:GMP synthase (glutamine-hydrolysing)
VKNLLAIRHVPFEDLGSLAPMLAEKGYAIRYVDAPTADFLLLAKGSWDLLVVLGGPIGVDDMEDYPFMAPELKFIETRLRAALPTLGICLGSQFLAKALGATVRKGECMEIGWKPLTLTQAGQSSPVRHFSGPVLHWHGDQFDLPKDALALAATDLTPCQGFSWGRALALQFHPEVTARGLEQWYVGNVGEIREQGLTPAGLRRDAERHAPAMERQAAAMLGDWLALLG